MKSSNLFPQKLKRWLQRYNFNWLTSSLAELFRGNKPHNEYAHRRNLAKTRVEKKYYSVIIILAIISLTLASGYNFFYQARLQENTIAPETILAPKLYKVVNAEETEKKQKFEQAKTESIPFWRQDKVKTEQIQIQLAKYLSYIDSLRNLHGISPFLTTKILTPTEQDYLLAISAKEWRDILEKTQNKNLSSNNFPLLTTRGTIIQKIIKYRTQANINQKEFSQLINQINQARKRYQLAQKKLQVGNKPQLETEEIITLINLQPSSWQIVKTTIQDSADKILTQGVVPGLPTNIKQAAIAKHLKNLSTPVAAVAEKLLLSTLESEYNLVKDEKRTEEEAHNAAKKTEPVYFIVEEGKPIVRAKQVINAYQAEALEHFGLSGWKINYFWLIIWVVLISGIITIFTLIQRRVYPNFRRRDYILLWFLSLTTLILPTIFEHYHLRAANLALNLPAIALLTSSFYNPLLAISQVILLSFLMALNLESIPWSILIGSTVGALVAGGVAHHMRSREGMARLGVAIGLTQAGVYFCSQLLLTTLVTGTIDDNIEKIWQTLLPGAIIFGLAGLAWNIFALGISPYLERVFDLVTPIRLAELSNPNIPLLKQLATKTPGTFQHTMSVASLAEAAARELNCNVELTRAGTLYHDIGKMHDPLGFIENQKGGPNKHDQINDPYESVKIIKKHVSEGLVIARKHRLPKLIRDFIPEHQGTLLIAYFYHQAKEQAETQGKPPPLESDFRYPGPIPQSREAGIMMLADGCEAALRSLKDMNPQKALHVVTKILKARWQDGQLADSQLKYEELPRIADIFVEVWQQCNHKRISYPKEALEVKQNN